MVIFSKLDEILIEVFMPYVKNPDADKISELFSGFVFWLTSSHYDIIFVDPKVTEHTQIYNINWRRSRIPWDIQVWINI